MDFVSLQPGDTINEKYELLDQLGAGAFGAVFRARQLGIDRIVAIKCLLSEAGKVDETAIERFKREARLSSALEHPNTITIHDYGQTEQGVMYLVMEYVRGVTLKQILKAEHRLPPKRSIRIVRQVLSSLQEAHSRGIVHRDMKPANIMLFNRLSEKDVVKVLDFGIAKFVSNDGQAMGEARDDLTVAGRIVGTPRYMAPEQVNGKGAFPASDLYGLGLILYEMLAGKQAVSGDSTLTLIAQQISSSPIIDPNDPGIPEPVRPILAKATAKNMLERYQSAADFLQDLEGLDLDALDRWASGAPLPPTPDRAMPPSFSGEFRSVDRSDASGSGPRPLDAPPEGRGRWGLIAAVGILILGLAAVGITFSLMGDNTTGPDNTALASVTNNTAPKTGPPAEDEDKAADPDAAPKEQAAGEAATKGAEGDSQEGAEAPAARQVTINSEPPGADVLQNGETLGQTPLTLTIPPDHPTAFEVALVGYEKQTLDLTPESEPTVSVALKATPPQNEGGRKAAPGSAAAVRIPPNTSAAAKGNGKTDGKTDGKGKGETGGKGTTGGNDYEVF